MTQEARIIPARAGFTARTHARQRREQDHPRSRGVYVVRKPKTKIQLGSSPLARGLPFIRRITPIINGIIPARAGFTFPRSVKMALQRDHPRSRGVYQGTTPHRPSAAGSSPLARGLRATASALGGRAGIIPARAGFTRGRSCAGRRRADHPRSRGVYR